MLALKLGQSLPSTGTESNIFSLNFNGTDEYVTVDGVVGDIEVGLGTISVWTKVNTTIQGVGTTFVSPNLDNKPTFSITNAGESFMYYETLETPGITNYTHLTRTTTIESISDSTSTFSQ